MQQSTFRTAFSAVFALVLLATCETLLPPDPAEHELLEGQWKG